MDVGTQQGYHPDSPMHLGMSDTIADMESQTVHDI